MKVKSIHAHTRYFPGSEAVFAAVCPHGVLPDFVDRVHVVPLDQLRVLRLLLPHGPRHADVVIRPLPVIQTVLLHLRSGQKYFDM